MAWTAGEGWSEGSWYDWTLGVRPGGPLDGAMHGESWTNTAPVMYGIWDALQTSVSHAGFCVSVVP